MYRRRRPSNKGSFNPDDEKNVKHSRIGVWEFYEDKNPQLARIPGSSRLEPLLEIIPSLPYLWRMLNDLRNIDNLWPLLCMYLAVEVVASLVPAVALW
jgi:membrane protein required for beta-lactamase induction